MFVCFLFRFVWSLIFVDLVATGTGSSPLSSICQNVNHTGMSSTVGSLPTWNYNWSSPTAFNLDLSKLLVFSFSNSIGFYGSCKPSTAMYILTPNYLSLAGISLDTVLYLALWE